VLFTNTNGVVALAVDPATVGPDSDPTVIVAPDTKFVPEIVTDWLADTPYVTAAGVTLVIVG
jgi:hypothetical protein